MTGAAQAPRFYLPAQWRPAAIAAQPQFSADPDGLHAGAFVHALTREFAVVAGILHAAKGQARIAFHYPVDEGAARLHAPCEGFTALGIARPYTPTQTVGTAVGDFDCRGFVAHADHARHRAEQLLAPGTHAGLNAVENRGRVVRALAGERRAAEQQVRALVHRILNLLVQTVAQI